MTRGDAALRVLLRQGAPPPLDAAGWEQVQAQVGVCKQSLCVQLWSVICDSSTRTALDVTPGQQTGAHPAFSHQDTACNSWHNNGSMACTPRITTLAVAPQTSFVHKLRGLARSHNCSLKDPKHTATATLINICAVSLNLHSACGRMRVQLFCNVQLADFL